MRKRNLTGVVVVTGAAGGLGSAVAHRFDRAGARVVLLDIDAQRLSVVADALPGALSRVCDLTDFEECNAAVAATINRFGGIDLLVNIAGMTHRSPFLETEPAVIQRVMNVNFFTAVNMTSAALPVLTAREGAVAVVSSVAGFAPLLGRTGYVASKHALHGLFDTLRAELREVGVDVTIVAPTFIDTEMQARAIGGDGAVTTRSQSRVGGEVTPDEVADRLYRAVERRRRTVVIGPVGHLTRMMTKFTPRLYERMMARSLRSELES